MSAISAPPKSPEQCASDLSRKLAATLDATVHSFVNGTEGRDVPIHEILQSGDLQQVKLRCHAHQQPEEFEDFFVWRKQVLAYRIIQGSFTNESSRESIMEMTLQSRLLPESEWPEALRAFLNDAK